MDIGINFMFSLIIPTAKRESARDMGFPTFRTNQFPNHKREFRESLVIRWGNSHLFETPSGSIREFKYVANPSEAIHLNCDKYRARRTFAEVVNTPEDFTSGVPKGKYAVVRPESHAAGSGFKIVKGPFIVPDWHYASEFVETDTEYRIWFANGKTFVGKRVALNGESEKMACRSTWGYSYRDVPNKLHKDTLAAAKAINLIFGAADVLIKRNKYYFLELNSSPSVDAPSVCRFFRENILKYAQSRGF